MSAVCERVDAGVMIPELLRAAPQVRVVLDRYGLRGCGGRWGPAESLGYFARAHGVPVERLLGEIRDRLAEGPSPGGQPAEPPGLADTIYRPFVKAGILTVLTLGATWGAYLLWRIGSSGSFAAAGLHEVNAHGHAQIFGWVGLFVMGIAYQALPRFRHTSLPHPRLAYLSLWLMLGGLIARSVLQPLAPTHPALLVPAVLASALEVVAVGLFAWIVVRIVRDKASTGSALDAYVLCSVGWFVVQAVAESVYLTATLRATGADLVGLVATWQPALRDVQIHGFALLMILGFSQRLLHPIFGLPAPRSRRALLALACFQTAIAGEAASLVLMSLHGRAWAAPWYGSVLLLLATSAYLVSGWRLFSRPAEPERGVKFLRAALVWLFVSLGMLALLPAYQHGLLPLLAPESAAARMGFSHAYYGATRHAITVGFVSLTIVGVASRIVPTLNGVAAHSLPGLWAPFLLINVGCAVRVLGQVATDLTSWAFPVTGLSGVLEVTGLALWGGHLWAVMAGRYASRESQASLEPGGVITPDHLVADVLKQYPGLLPLFIQNGFTPLRNPLLRATVARHISLARACALLGVDAEGFIAALNAERGQQPTASNESSHPTKPGVPSMSPTEILKSEHRIIEQVSSCLEVLADRAAAGNLDEPAARQALDFFGTFADGCHHHKEEDHLFPALEAHGLPRQGGPTGVMLAEHEQGRGHIRAMMAALDRHDAWPFVSHARAYVRLLRSHIAKEDDVLFPRADRILSDSEQRAVVAAFSRVEEKELHAGTHERYLRLADELAEHLGVARASEAAGERLGCGCHSCGCHAG
jgi:hemerythrin-like domain-containing protein